MFSYQTDKSWGGCPPAELLTWLIAPILAIVAGYMAHSTWLSLDINLTEPLSSASLNKILLLIVCLGATMIALWYLFTALGLGLIRLLRLLRAGPANLLILTLSHLVTHLGAPWLKASARTLAGTGLCLTLGTSFGVGTALAAPVSHSPSISFSTTLPATAKPGLDVQKPLALICPAFETAPITANPPDDLSYPPEETTATTTLDTGPGLVTTPPNLTADANTDSTVTTPIDDLQPQAAPAIDPTPPTSSTNRGTTEKLAAPTQANSAKKSTPNSPYASSQSGWEKDTPSTTSPKVSATIPSELTPSLALSCARDPSTGANWQPLPAWRPPLAPNMYPHIISGDSLAALLTDCPSVITKPKTDTSVVPVDDHATKTAAPKANTAGSTVNRLDTPKLGTTASKPFAHTHTVAPGENLWQIVRDHSQPGASAAYISQQVQAVYLANRPLIGPDPNLIHPGIVLNLTDRK